MHIRRIILSAFLFLLLILVAWPSKATHLMGTDITYTCVNACTIEVHQRVYRDCAGAQGVSIQDFSITGAPGCAVPNQIGTWLPGNDPAQVANWQVTEVTPVCPGTITQCQNAGSPIRGVQEYHRWTQFNICGLNCTNYTIEWWGQNRNGGITSGAANQGLGSFQTTINTALGGCNSSPQFNNPPVPYLCAGQPFTFNQGANDPDGDSLSYALGPCTTDQNVSINYNPGFSANSPLGASWTVSINPVSGDVSFIPNPGNIEVGVMCVYVYEWRNGQIINTVVRDMQINVISCPNNSQPVANNVTNILNGMGQGNSSTGIFVGTCLGSNLCFDIPLFDANAGDTITAWWNHAIPGGQFFLSGNPGIQDTLIGPNPTATFCWTPTSTGTFSFLVEMRDNACPNFGFSQFTVTIVVSNPVVLASLQNLDCDTATLCALPFNGVPPYQYSWSGQGGLSGPGACITHVYPSPGSYSYSVTVTDSIGCQTITTGNVVIPNLPVADAGPDFIVCQSFSDTIGSAPQSGMNYLWTPTTGLSSSTVSNPLLSLVNPGPTVQQFQYIVTVTETSSGCVDSDTMNLTISYPAQLGLVPDHIECYGTPTGGIDMTVTNGLAPFLYTWSGPNGFGATTEDLTNIYAGTYYVTVTDDAGCESYDSITIVQPPSPLWVSLISTNICCNGSTDGIIDATMTGDSPPYIFSWTGPNGFSANSEDISGLGAGVYQIVVSDSIGCVISDSIEIFEPSPIVFNFTGYDVACNGESNGIIAADISGGYGNYSYLWTPGGQTTDSITGLVAGTYELLVRDTCFGDSLVTIFFEDFEGHSPWTLNNFTGPNGAEHNLWAINDGEGGVAPGGCAAFNNGDTTLHIVRLSNPNGAAIYEKGGSCGTGGPCAETNLRAESPWISTLGYSNLTLEFDYISVGDALLDNCALLYNVGGGWIVLNPSIKTLTCSPGQGQWTRASITLPANANNVANLQIGFNWTNNDDGAGSDPSIAINDVRVFAPRIFNPSVCEVSDTFSIQEPAILGDTIVPTHVLCFGDSTGSATITATGGNGNYHFAWSNGGVGATVGNLPAGTYYVTVTDTAYTPAGGPAGFLTCTHLDTVVITEPPLLVINATATNTSCFQGSDGEVTVSVVGGTPGYSFLWNTTPTQSTQTVISLPTGAYTVTVTDTNGCQVSDQTVVSQPSPIAVAMSMQNSTCGLPNGTATASPSGGTPGYTYQWGTNPVQTGPVATGLMAGLVQVTVTDANGCQSFGQINVGNEPRPTILLDYQRNLLCFGDTDGEAGVVANGGRPPYTFNWSNGQSGPVANNLPAGTHYAYVTDFFGCTDTLAVTILEPTPVGGTTLVQDMGCNSTVPDGTVGVLPTGGTPGYSFVWSTVPIQTQQMATGLAPGIYFVTVTDQNGCTFVTSDTVEQIPRPDVTAGPMAQFCEGEGGAMIFATSSGGLQPHYFSWWCDSTNTFCGLDSINDNDPIANPDTSTWYYVYVTDNNGCRSDTDSVFVVVLPKPIVDAGPDIILCGDSAPCEILNPIITNAPGPYTYLWSPGIGLNDSTILNPCARPDTTTIYTLVVTAGNGCNSTLTTVDTLSSVTVFVNPIPIAEAGPDRDICYGDSAILQGYGTNAGPAYEFEWSPSQGLSDTTIANPYAFPTLTSTYTLVVWSNGCPSYADTVQVNVHTIPTVDAGWDREICLGDTAILDAQAWGDSTATYSFNWYPGYGIVGPTQVEDAFANPDSTTTYYVVTTTSWGCESEPDSMTVYLKPTPIAEAGPNLTICGNDSILLQGSYSYTTTDSANPTQVYFAWTPNQHINDTTLATPTVWPPNSMFYYLEVRHNTCSTRDSMLVTVIPEVVAAYAADTNVICQHDSVQLNATGGLGGASFTWSPPDGLSNPNAANPMAAPDTTTTYTLIVSEGGCTDVGEITIEVLPTPEASYLSSLPDGCPPHAVNFIQNSEGGINFIWNFGDGTSVSNEDFPVHIYDHPGTYQVSLIAESPGGCADTANLVTVTVYDTAMVDFSSSPNFPVEMFLPTTHVQFHNHTDHAVGYVWNFGDGIFSEELNPGHFYESPGSYFVTLTATNALGCHSTVTKGPFVVSLPDLFIPNVFSPNGDGINDVFLVNYTGSQPFTLQIMDRWGVKVYDGNNKTQGWDGKDLNNEDVPDGIYYYVVKIGGREFTGPVTLVR